MKCDICKKQIDRKKHLHRLKRLNYCSECYKENKKNHRKKTIKEEGIEEDLKQLTNKMKREWAKNNPEKVRSYSRKSYEKHLDYTPKRYKTELPQIKNSKLKVKKEKNNFYLTFRERQAFFRILIRRGLDEEEAKERIQDLVDFEKQLSKRKLNEKQSEEKIKQKQAKMLEELFRY